MGSGPPRCAALDSDYFFTILSRERPRRDRQQSDSSHEMEERFRRAFHMILFANSFVAWYPLILSAVK
jgi:hypothetical protein